MERHLNGFHVQVNARVEKDLDDAAIRARLTKVRSAPFPSVISCGCVKSVCVCVRARVCLCMCWYASVLCVRVQCVR